MRSPQRQLPVHLLVLFSLAGASPVLAGEIAGIRSQLPPSSNPDAIINFSNDFLGRGGSIDDFRTTQIIVSARFGEKWLATLDHSTLTLEAAPQMGRIDQFTASLGYSLIDNAAAGRISRLSAGTGLRSVGDFAGERMQNGFHRVVGSDITVLPYLDSSGAEPTLWIDSEHYADFHHSTGNGFLGGWQSGYWVRASSLATGNGQWDSALGAYIVTAKRPVEFWFGLRHDWRSGYDQDFVQRATAQQEQDTAVVLGLKFGALVFETVQQFENDTSYGQLKLVATGHRSTATDSAWPGFAVEFAVLLPQAEFQLAGKFRSHLLSDTTSGRREFVSLEARYGEPQYRDNTSLFVRSKQLAATLEWERPIARQARWLSAYGSVGAAWRSEQLLGDAEFAGQRSDSVERATAVLAAGVRINAASLAERWLYRLQLGVNAWVPASTARFDFSGVPAELHRAGIAISLGMTFEHH